MGIESASKSRYLYEIYDNFTIKQTDYYATFDSKPYDSGTFRYCYKGEIKDKNGKPSKPPLFPNEKCMVKIFKNKNYEVKDFVKDLSNYFYAKNASILFNRYFAQKNIPRLYYVSSYISSLQEHAKYNLLYFIPIKDSDQMEKIKDNELIVIEPFLEGNYEKYINNICKESYETDKTISFFLHWNWVYTKGKSLLCDLQGVKRKNYFELTDPAVQSIDKIFGEADLGSCSLILFLANHKHNENCKDLRWPNDHDMDKIKKIGREIILSNKCKDYKNIYMKLINSAFEYKSDDSLFFIIILIIILFICCIIKKCQKRNNNNNHTNLKEEFELKEQA